MKQETLLFKEVSVSTGELLKLWLSLLSFKKAIMSESQVKMLREELSHIDMLTSSTKTRWVTTTQSIKLPEKDKAAENSLLPTHIYLNLLLWVTNLDMLRHIQTLLYSGRHNSVTLPMEHKLSSISSIAQVKPSGT